MAFRDNFTPCTRRNPCPICGKPDWCAVSNDGITALCGRTPSPKQTNNGLYIHILRPGTAGGIKREPPKLPRPKDYAPFDYAARKRITTEQINALAKHLGDAVTADALRRLGCGYFRNRYTIPMRSPWGAVYGIYTREPGNPEREKCNLTGSTNGLFYDPEITQTDVLIIAEGMSDTAALIAQGLPTVGRPGADACFSQLVYYAERVKAQSVIIVADNDERGINGAFHLADTFTQYRIEARVVYPPKPYKDARQAINAGRTWADFEGTGGIIPRHNRQQAGRIFTLENELYYDIIPSCLESCYDNFPAMFERMSAELLRVVVYREIMRKERYKYFHYHKQSPDEMRQAKITYYRQWVYRAMVDQQRKTAEGKAHYLQTERERNATEERKQYRAQWEKQRPKRDRAQYQRERRAKLKAERQEQNTPGN